MNPTSVRVDKEYFAVMPTGIQKISPGYFGFMDGKDVRGKENLAIYQMVCKKVRRNRQTFSMLCVDPLGTYSCDKLFVKECLFATFEEAKAKITRILRRKLARIKSQLAKL